MKFRNSKLIKKMTAIILSVCLLITCIAPVMAFATDDPHDQTANIDIVRKGTLSYTKKGDSTPIPLKNNDTIDDIANVEKFTASYNFKISETIGDNGGPVRTVHMDDYYLIDLPSNIKAAFDEKHAITDKNTGGTIATFEFIAAATNTQIKVQFAQEIDDPDLYNIEGHFDFDFNLDLTGWEEGEDKTVVIPIGNDGNITIVVTKPNPPVTPPPANLEKSATYNEKARILTWKIVMTPTDAVFEGCTFTDTIDTKIMDFISVMHGNTALESTEYTFDKTSGLLSYTIPHGRNSNTITIITQVKAEVYDSTDVTTIANQAHLNGGAQHVNIDSNTAEKKITPQWIKKTGSPIEGNRIEWKITVNTSQQTMLNAVITDVLSSDLTLDKNAVYMHNGQTNSQVTVQAADFKPTGDWKDDAYLTYDQTTNTIKYYFARTVDNATSNTFTLSFITDVKRSPDVTVEQQYTNKAKLDVEYLGGDGLGHGVIVPDIITSGVGVPNLYVAKSGNAMNAGDKRDGTLRWTIKTASNVSEYGVSRVIDTLPADQSFIAGEIYCNGVQLSETSTPVSAKIDGQKLIIDFHDTQALTREQTITVKTKIDPAIYGNNITNKNFTNDVTSMLYEKDITTMPSLEAKNIIEKESNSTIKVSNTVIDKSVAQYITGPENAKQNPRVDFNIVINKNLMPLKNVVITDDLDQITTTFKDNAGAVTNVDNAKWLFVENSLSIELVSGNSDKFTAAQMQALIAGATYDKTTNVFTVPFSGEIKDSYRLSITAELNASEYEIFQNNGTIQCNGNTATINADGFNQAGVTSKPTTNSDPIKNELLGKSGVAMPEEQQIVWTVNLNQHKYKLKSTRVIDILPEGLTIDPTSVRLYSDVIKVDGSFMEGSEVEEKATLVEDFDYQYIMEFNERSRLVVDLPNDMTSYVLRFATDVDDSVLDKEINNTAYYAGADGVEENKDGGDVVVHQSAGGTSNKKGSIEVSKQSGDNGVFLEGAKFDLHWLPNGKEPVYVRTLTTGKDGTMNFRGLALNEKYSITEVVAPNGFLIDDATPHEFTVSEGGGNQTPMTFENTPEKSGQWTLSAQKHLDGRLQQGQQFEFEVVDGAGKIVLNGKTTEKMPNSDDYKITFTVPHGQANPFEFTNAYTFTGDETQHLASQATYYIREVEKTNMPGYGFDNVKHYITVEAWNIKGEENLKIVVKDENNQIITDDNGQFLADRTPIFMNTYRANGDIQLSATKKLTGHALAAGQFTFELFEDGTDTPIQSVTNKVGTFDNNVSTGYIDFDKISFDQYDVGGKTYIIKEKDTSASGYSYDLATFKVKLDVTDNGDGTLFTTITAIEKTKDEVTSVVAEMVFENTYTTTDTDVLITANKALSGRAIEEQQFSFRFVQTDEAGKAIGNAQVVKNDLNGDFRFDKLIYKQADIGKSFYYQVSEINDKHLGYTYDSAVYTIKITVVDNNDGTLSTIKVVTKDGTVNESGITFENVYKADGSTQITAEKSLIGKALPNEKFSFTLTNVEKDGTVISTIETVKNAKDGTIVFEPIKYTEADAAKTYYYLVSESNDSKAGYTYDATTYMIEIAVTDNGDGTLNAQQSITRLASAGTPELTKGITFANEYTASGTTVIEATKNLDGRLLENEQFEFILEETDEKGTPIGESQTVLNNKDGKATFSPLTYTQQDIGKDYFYSVFEKNTEADGYTYDASKYMVKVIITDERDNGELTVTQLITNAKGKATDKIQFENAYAAQGSVSLSAKKVLNGEVLKDKQFTFELFEQGNAKAIQSVFNDGDGKIIFDKINYTQDDIGKHTYTIKEAGDKLKGYTYDDVIYTVEVTVSDNGDGTLDVKTAILKTANGSNEAVSEMTFNNVFTPDPQTNSPDTGDNIPAISLLTLSATSFLFILLSLKKKRKA